MRIPKFLFLLFILVPFSFDSFAQEELTTFILVRHAEKIDDSRDPKLNSAGLERAVALSRLLSTHELDVIYSTDYLRTKMTVEPVATLQQMEVNIYDPRNPDFILKMLEDHKGQTILVSGHSNTTPAAVNKLLGADEFEDLDHDEYGTIFIVSVSDVTKPSVLTLHY